MSDQVGIPDYDSLPEVEGGARSGWGIFGPGDNLGLMNLQTEERVVKAASLIRTGRVFTLDAPVDFLGPAETEGGRGAPRHVITNLGGFAFDDHLDGFFPQGSTQWDALGHVGFKPGVFYNNTSTSDIAEGRRYTIEHLARKGIVGRAVLLDVKRAMEADGRTLDPFGSYGITVDDLELAREMGGITYEPGDVILIRTGHIEGLAALPAKDRRVPFSELTTPGLDHTEEVARYIWNTHASAVAADNMALEVWPSSLDIRGPVPGPGWPFGYMHNVYIGLFGLTLGEYFWLADLASDCAGDGRYEMFFSSVPLNVPGGIGSPPSAAAIK
jgi:Putative cyclase